MIPRSGGRILVRPGAMVARRAGASFAVARAVATSNQTLSGTATIDGVSCTAGHLVLLTAQTTASENGLWTVAAGAWTRYVVAQPSMVFAYSGTGSTSVTRDYTLWVLAAANSYQGAGAFWRGA